jgi:hypothetical protein
MTMGDFFVSKSKDVDLFFHEVALMKQLILEHTHPLELLRELISNSGAKEVEARTIHITYHIDPEYGHTFKIKDDGIGMNFTNNALMPGRLDRFLGLGLSAISGLKSDEFSWKGLGSKLAYQSRRLEIETYNGTAAYNVMVNEPWRTIEEGKKPKPNVSEIQPSPGQHTGTTVKVFGYPPHSQKAPFTIEEVSDYLRHRTFVGFTGVRHNPPKIFLTVQTRTEEIPFGFPEIINLPEEAPEGTVFVKPVTININVPGTNQNVTIFLKGLYTWDEEKYGLASVHQNTGLILSVMGIPYFTLNMRDLGSGQLAVANPGENKCCLIVECDSIQTEMNISRSALVDSPLTDHFRKLVSEAILKVENTATHRSFRQVPKLRKDRKSAQDLGNRKKELEKPNQSWVYWQRNESEIPKCLMREPTNETETLAILWKLEALDALPFRNFETLAYSGKGADLVVHFQEDDNSNPERYATMEVEFRFFNFKAHEHLIPQFPTVICWDINPKPKLKPTKLPKGYKYIVQLADTTLRIFALKEMPGIFVKTSEEMKREEISRAWSSNL